MENHKDDYYTTLPDKNYNKFPRIAILIVIAEVCERFSYSGMRAFLALYLRSKLMYSDDEATEIYHWFSTLVYFFPIFGAILADNYLGKFRTILYMMFVYAAGNVIVAVAAIPDIYIPPRLFTLLGMLLITVGAGGIKPCAGAFGGEQFKLPEQEKHLETYFSLLYFTICAGSLLAKTVSPILRAEVQCFGDKDCYSLAFGAPGLLMAISIVIFASAKSRYIIKKPSGNIMVKFIKCIMLGLKNKFNGKQPDKSHHWLDTTSDSYEPQFIADIKQTLSILIIYLPFPVFWALLDQMGSRWTLQATRLNGNFKYFTIKPDQIQVMCPIMILVIIPLFQKYLYPALEKHNILKNPLHKFTLGGIFMALAFVAPGILELYLQKSYPILPQVGNSQLRLFNGYKCNVKIYDQYNNISAIILPSDFYEKKDFAVTLSRNISLRFDSDCDNITRRFNHTLLLEEKQAVSYFLVNPFEETGIVRYLDHVEKSRSGFPLIRFLLSKDVTSSNSNLTFYNNLREENEKVLTENNEAKQHDVFASNYNIYVNDRLIKDGIQIREGGVYTFIVGRNSSNDMHATVLTITQPNSITIAWMIPQFLIMSTAEVLFGVTGMGFSFTEAPENMKAVLQAAWLLTEAFGNILIIIITRLASEYTQATQFFFYTGLMLLSVVIFHIISRNYKFSSDNKAMDNHDIIDKEDFIYRKKERSNSEVLYLQVKQCDV